MHGISSKFFAYFQGISLNSVGPDIQQLAGIPGIRRNVNFFSVEQNANKKTSPLKVQDLTSQKVPKHKQKQKNWQIKALKLFFWQQCLYFRSMNKTIPFQGSKHPPMWCVFSTRPGLCLYVFFLQGKRLKIAFTKTFHFSNYLPHCHVQKVLLACPYI